VTALAQLGRLENSAVKRYGFALTDESLVRLISEVVLAREPAQLDVVGQLRTRRLTEDEREAIREILADELLENGLGPDDEPNERGSLIETAIDWLGRQ
jgi:hypothetical protein